MPEIVSLYRYPVKGLSPEPLDRATLTPGRAIAGDRAYAIAQGDTAFDPAAPAYLPKTHFLMLMRNEQLATLRTKFDAASCELLITGPDGATVRGRLDRPDGRHAIVDFITAFMPAALRGTPHIVHAEGHTFSDVAAQVVSLINLESCTALEPLAGRAVNPLRFRANLYFRGAPAWAELAWIGRRLRIGAVELEVIKRIQRCAATNVDPVSGVRDLNIPYVLQRNLGHADNGVYARVVTGGEIKPGDALALV
jgi:uncharacterized protein YcbX